MTSQGEGGTGAAGGPPEDETRVDWAASGADAVAPPAPSAGPPPAPDAQAPASGYTYPAQLADTPEGPPPATPAPPAGPPPAYPTGGGYPPPVASWAPPEVPVGAMAGTSPLKFGGVLPRFLAWTLDGLLLSIALGVISGILGAVMGSGDTAFLVATVVYIGMTFLYFVGLWTGGSQATFGMRLFHLRVGNAADGRTLTMSQAAMRWFALGFWINALALLPAPAGSLLSFVGLFWYLGLLISTAASATRQGFHDRLARSAMVAPVGNEGPVIPCVVLFVLLVVILPILSIVALLFLGAQVTEILQEVGTSV